jgi:hypothetical protein
MCRRVEFENGSLLSPIRFRTFQLDDEKAGRGPAGASHRCRAPDNAARGH